MVDKANEYRLFGHGLACYFVDRLSNWGTLQVKGEGLAGEGGGEGLLGEWQRAGNQKLRRKDRSMFISFMFRAYALDCFRPNDCWNRPC